MQGYHRKYAIPNEASLSSSPQNTHMQKFMATSS